MVEFAVVEASDTISAPFCAPFDVEVEMVGAAAFGVMAPVIVDTTDAAPPHPLNKAHDKKPAVRIFALVLILEYSFWPRPESRSFRRIHSNTAAFHPSIGNPGLRIGPDQARNRIASHYGCRSKATEGAGGFNRGSRGLQQREQGVSTEGAGGFNRGSRGLQRREQGVSTP
jgi:hypothetical protein